MSTPSLTAVPTSLEVGAWFDHVDGFCKLISGDSFHYGRWPGPGWPGEAGARYAGQPVREQVTEAQDLMTDFLAGQLELAPGEHLLDVGCGHGTPAIRTAGRAGVSVTGCSTSPVQVQEAGRRAAASGLSGRVSFEYGDAQRLPYGPGQFDAAWALDALPHTSDPGAAMRELRRVVRPPGPVLVTFYTQRVPATEAELAMCREGFAFCSLLTPGQVRELAAEAGLDLELVHDLTEDIAPTCAGYARLYHDNRALIAGQFGGEFADAMDAALPRLLSFLTDKTGYLACLMRGSRESR
jgi:cyclopropane fatty-acyl-phospholipid synthase-like methyltransferase